MSISSERAASVARVLVVLGSILSVAEARADGLYVSSDRGVRPLGRGGAFVAGTDDLGAIFYNPAGIYDAGSQFLLDASIVNFNADYTRTAQLRQVDPNDGHTVAIYQQTFPTVSATSAPLPIPTIAGSFSPHPDWMIAFGAYAPYAALPTYPDTVNKAPAPQRYSLITLDGSILVVLGGYVAWAPLKNLRLGAGIEALVGAFNAQTNMSACIPERFFCSPEDPHWDVLAQIQAAPIITPSGNIGVQWEFAKGWRLGSSFHLPFWIRAPATIKTRLPSAPLFNGVTTQGDSATVVFSLPFTARLGIEMRDVAKNLRIELAGHYEQWDMHQTINVEGADLALVNVPGFPQKYFVPDIQIPRDFQNSGGVELGGEYTIKASDTVDVIPRLGFSFESSAIPSDYLSVLTIDSNKVTPSGGISVRIGHVRLDAVYARVIGFSTEVASKDAKIAQTIPIQANPPVYPDYINAGSYSWNANVFGLGMTYTFGHPEKPDEKKKETEPLPTTEETNKKASDAKPDDSTKSADTGTSTSTADDSAKPTDKKPTDKTTKMPDPTKPPPPPKKPGQAPGTGAPQSQKGSGQPSPKPGN